MTPPQFFRPDLLHMFMKTYRFLIIKYNVLSGPLLVNDIKHLRFDNLKVNLNQNKVIGFVSVCRDWGVAS